MANNERTAAPAGQNGQNSPRAGQDSNSARRRRRRRGNGNGPRTPAQAGAENARAAQPQGGQGQRRPRPNGQNSQNNQNNPNRGPRPQGASGNQARQGGQNGNPPRQNNGPRRGNDANRGQSRQNPQNGSLPRPNNGQRGAAQGSGRKDDRRTRGGNAAPRPTRTVPENPALPLITRRPPKQKFQNFEEYIAAHGGATAPIEGEEPQVVAEVLSTTEQADEATAEMPPKAAQTAPGTTTPAAQPATDE